MLHRHHSARVENADILQFAEEGLPIVLAAAHLVDRLRLFFYLKRRAKLLIFSLGAGNIIVFFNMEIRQRRIMLIDQYLALPICAFPLLIIAITCAYIVYIYLRFHAAIFMQIINLLSYLYFSIAIVHLWSHRSFSFKSRDVTR